jgi:hypothetical protein
MRIRNPGQKQCCRSVSASIEKAGSGSALNGKARAEEAHNGVLVAHPRAVEAHRGAFEDLRPLVVDSHHFDEEADSDPDLHQSERSASGFTSPSQ